MDRNKQKAKCDRSGRVALLAEGVDRNFEGFNLFTEVINVALLAEGVDRNPELDFAEVADAVSPSSRRAWIEIALCRSPAASGSGRPPRGGRG